MLPKNVVRIYKVYIKFCKIPECQHKYTPCVEIHNWLLNVKKKNTKKNEVKRLWETLKKNGF